MTLTPDDRLALFDLVARANHALHVRDGEGWAATFAEDGVSLTEGGEEVRGQAALAAMIDGIPPNTERHWAGNFVLEVVDDAVVMRSDAAVLDMNRVLHAGRRTDTLRRLDGQWRFVERRFVAGPPAA